MAQNGVIDSAHLELNRLYIVYRTTSAYKYIYMLFSEEIVVIEELDIGVKSSML